jgi:hypothetical protein
MDMNICWLNQNESEKFYFIIIFILSIIKEKKIYKMGMGIGDWGLGIGDWAQSQNPNPQSPIPNPQFILKYNNYRNKE